MINILGIKCFMHVSWTIHEMNLWEPSIIYIFLQKIFLSHWLGLGRVCNVYFKKVETIKGVFFTEFFRVPRLYSIRKDFNYCIQSKN